MRTKQMSLALYLWGVLASTQETNHSVFSNAGEPLSNTRHSLNFTLGEPIIGPIASKQTLIDQGFWAGFNIIDPLQPNSVTETDILVYPVPVVDNLNIVSGRRQLFGLKLFAIDSRMVLSSTITSEQAEHQVDVSAVAPGAYVLQLFLRDTSETLLFKIVKE